MAKVIVGIDPGMDGGIAAITVDEYNRPESLKTWIMPTKAGSKNSRDVDARRLSLLLELNKSSTLMVGLELVHAMPKQGVTSSFNFGKSLGKIQGVLEATGMPYMEVTPQAWQKSVLAGLGKGGGTKKASVRYCLNAFPNNSFLATDRSKVPHDGMTDAACIAEYIRRMLLETTPGN